MARSKDRMLGDKVPLFINDLVFLATNILYINVSYITLIVVRLILVKKFKTHGFTRKFT